MELRVDGTALVTGASSGLGRHFAKVLARAGANIVAAARRMDKLDALAAEIAVEGGRCVPLEMDVTSGASVAQAFARLPDLAGGPVGLIVNNAGVTLTKAARDIEEHEWRRVIDANLTGAFLVAQAGAAQMPADGGAIVNIASILGKRVSKGLAPYIASKAALIALTEALALEWAPRGIRVNALAPGYIETDLNREFFQSEAGRRLIDRIPARRLGLPGDLDSALLFLCSSASGFTTGATVPVDGGHLVNSL